MYASSGAGTRGCAGHSQRACRDRPTSSTISVESRGPRSISSQLTMASLQDLVSYSQKHNEVNGEDNQDGTNDNESANWSVEGFTDDVQVLERRERVKRAMLATLLFSHGTPMLLAGDEFGRTQHGNNNAYG